VRSDDPPGQILRGEVQSDKTIPSFNTKRSPSNTVRALIAGWSCRGKSEGDNAGRSNDADG